MTSERTGSPTGPLQAEWTFDTAIAGKGLPAEIAHPFFWAPFAVIGEGGERGSVSANSHVSPHQLAGL